MGVPRGIIPTYTSDEVKQALRLLADEQPDEDSERRADLILALRDLPDGERRVISLYYYGYPLREIAEQVLGNRDRNAASRLLDQALANLRAGMNQIERGEV